MRPIWIMNVEGRIFFSLVEKRMSTYMTLNRYIKRWQQKAFMVEVAGCIKHSTLIFEALKEAKEEYIPKHLPCYVGFCKCLWILYKAQFDSLCYGMVPFPTLALQTNILLLRQNFCFCNCGYKKLVDWLFCLANWTFPRMLHVSNDIQCCFPNVAR